MALLHRRKIFGFVLLGFISEGSRLHIDALTAAVTSQRNVNVRREYLLPNLRSSEDARKKWLDFVWEKGGGLPLLGVISRESRQSTLDFETTVQRRMLIPIGMEEELIIDTAGSSDDNVDLRSSVQVQYQVVNGGLLSTEIVPSTHLGTVTFSPIGESKDITMVWDVTFDTTSVDRTGLWQAVTERTITDTCKNFVASLETPRIYRRTTILRPQAGKTLTPEETVEKWVDFCWKEGSGLLPIPPLNIENVRWIIPPFLKEKLVSKSVQKDEDGSIVAGEINYQVENANLFTYQVYSHRGRVQFVPSIDSNGTINMIWEVEIRPFLGWEVIVQAFTAAVVSCYARNFKCHVRYGRDAMVTLKPPRGGSGNLQLDIMQIRKDSWLGGVLEAHLNDKRSTAQQTLAIFQPWTWGRTASQDERGENEAWTEGYISS